MTTLSTTNTNTFDADTIETVTIGVSGYYDITAWGAQGGNGRSGGRGGLGAMASGDIYLQAGARLEIVVGARGSNGGQAGGGGGGGSFVIETNDGSHAVNINEVIAGGGGGGAGFTLAAGGAGSALPTGGAGGGSNPGAGGHNGAAGQGGLANFFGGGGGGGGYTGGNAGYVSNGSGGSGGPGLAGSTLGATFAGGAGSDGGGAGGLGGGGGGGQRGGGGGGGYGGGGGGGNAGQGGGGGSFVNAGAADVAKTAGSNQGDGRIEITLLKPPTITGGSTTSVKAGSTTSTPFAGVTIGDGNPYSPTETLTITLSDPGAKLAVGASHPAGVTFAGGNGVYTLTGTAANITSELDALTLSAPSALTGTSEVLTFTLSDTSSGYPLATTAVLTANISSRFDYTGAIQTFTVQTSGYYNITAAGAKGGNGGGGGQGYFPLGGFGAMASGAVYLQAGAQLEIVVGGQGRPAPGVGAGGGGGGSFVIETNDGSHAVNINEVIAGGGGGAGFYYSGGSGGTQPTGGAGGDFATNGGAGGVNGAGGHGADGGGGGFTGGYGASHVTGSETSQSGSANGTTFAGGAGGSNITIIYTGAAGGYGGGGGSGAGGGGGGGYGGGGGGGIQAEGGGGGSFVNASAYLVALAAGANSGNGYVIITAVTVPPIITVAGSTTSTASGSTTHLPFAGVTISDVNLNSPIDTLTITLSDANASLAIGASHPAGVTFNNLGGGVYTLTGSAANITSELDALTLTAPASLTGAVNGVETLTLSLSDTSSAYAQGPTTASVSVDLVAALPTITGGTLTNVYVGSTTGTPFAGVTITDTNLKSPIDTLTITLSDANASLAVGASHPAGVTFNNMGGGVYTLTGSAAGITSELDALTLTAPLSLTGAVDGIETLNFTLSDTSSADPSAASTATVTSNIYVPAPPVITGGSRTYATPGSTTTTPFAGVAIIDNNPNSPTDTLTITLSDANASLSVGAAHPAGVTFSNQGGGVYTLTGSAADITSELDALTLTAPTTLTGAVNGVEALTFSLSDTSSGDVAEPTTAALTTDILAPIFSKSFGYTGKIETFTVQTSGYYDITAEGAQGGNAAFKAGGLGALAGGVVYLQAGARFEIVVGGMGGSASDGGGGGGSFVIETYDGSSAVNINEVIAGGGGGADIGSDGGGSRTQGTGGDGGSGNGSAGGAGGVNGAAGAQGVVSYGPYGGGGGGFTGGHNAQDGSVDGTTFAGGDGNGGFGGGGSGVYGGGGGGGYGGGGGGAFGGGGGGGSFVNANAQSVTKVAATHGGDGQITITALVAPTITVASPVVHVTSGAPVNPFAGDVIGDTNFGNPIETLTITLSSPAKGVLDDPNAATDGSSYNPITGVYSISGTANDVTSALQHLSFVPTAGAYGDTTFSIQDLSSAYPLAISDFSTTVSDIAPCYCPGTLIRTSRGQVRVERLKIGDKVKTMSGALRPIKWIGQRSYGGRFIMGRTDILPVCIKAGALDDNVPKRDLWISPHHAMYLNGMLIEAKDLINGTSIVQAPSVDKVEYFHVELDTHDVIVAEGALSETFLDDDSRGMFHNARDYHALYPDAVAVPAKYCAPRCDSGYELETVRQRIAQRSGLPHTADTPHIGALRGFVDLVDLKQIEGWAQNVDHPEAPVCLDIYADGRLIGQTLANRYREDLDQFGSGRHSFAFTVPAGLHFAVDKVEVRRSLDGAALGFSEAASRALQPLTVVTPKRSPNVRAHRRAASG